ncbi:hypothetical protein GCK72_006083 [Caenorhabditis remanei]|uniref:Protein kinase domain-containing protein n=1 Tax=Caenorhabditis remanei TaxID=31234 RepID=A0A6A5HHB7_CAERE|nr:hypothetical protein GCK72_006083 [Caenorhabditis remanei]KAF1766127.1 hypothetical protein GCK72_006083 [Caenorhabditis remanei]
MNGGKNGSKLSSFKNLRQIGHGGFGVVYSAERNNGEKVAIKKIGKAALPSRVKEEIETMKRLDHRNIVKFYESFVDNDDTYVVMELCEGGSLIEFVKRRGPLDDATAVHILRQLIAAVKFIHSKNIIHRDLSAGNVFIKDATKAKMTVKLGDFGLATSLEHGGTACTIVGTPGYIAPQVFNQNYNQSADVYSLGAVLYTMLTKYPPPTNGPLDTSDLARRNRSAAELVKRMMETNPKRRIELREIVMSEFMKENMDEEGRFSREHSKDSRHQLSREPRISSRDERSQDRRPLRSSSQPVNSARMTHNRFDQERIHTASHAGNSSENDRGRARQRTSARGLGTSDETQSREQIWPIRMERLAGQRLHTAGGRYIIESDSRCRFEVAGQHEVVLRILIVEYNRYQQKQTVCVHKIKNRGEKCRNERDELIDVSEPLAVYTT